VDLHGLLGLDDPMGFFICLIGFSLQLWMARKNKWFFLGNLLFAAFFFVTFLSISEYIFRPVANVFPHRLFSWVAGLTTLWCVLMMVVWAGITLRDRIPGFNPRRRELFRASTVAICAAPVAVAAFGILTRKSFTVKEVEVKLPRLPRDLQNLRLVQVSDIHMGEFYSEKDLVHVVDAANELRGDLAIVTGDMITNAGDPLEACLKQLSRLKSTSGIWGCLGNHERYAHVENRATSHAAALGINFLRSKAVPLKFGGSTLNLVGVDYQSMHTPYLIGTEKLIAPGEFNLLLSHNPDVFPVAARQGFDFVLSGHTHGGQINVEILDKNLNMAEFITPYTKGLYNKAASAIYVNSGIGTIGIPIRLGAPAEITLIKLCAS
jgi:predicted MPP superfamily phosphohydrolase